MPTLRASTAACLCARSPISSSSTTSTRAAEMPFFGQDLFVQAQARGPRTTPAYEKALHHILDVADTSGLASVFAKYRLDALVASGNGPAELIDHVWGDRYENSGGWPPMCSAAAVAGYPSLTVPAGFVSRAAGGDSLRRPALARRPVVANRPHLRTGPQCPSTPEAAGLVHTPGVHCRVSCGYKPQRPEVVECRRRKWLCTAAALARALR